MEVPLDAAPGEYSMKMTITDRATDKSVTVTGKGKVLPADFGLVQVGTFADREDKVPTPPVGVVGQTLYLSFSVVGFPRDKVSKQPDVLLSLRVLDDKGKPTFQAPLTGELKKGIEEGLKVVPMQFALTLNRTGHFTVELTATCRICGKSSVVSFPLRVVPAK
jgi:hypothetical protein